MAAPMPLFDNPLPPVVQTARNHAMQRVAQKAEHVSPRFGDMARDFVVGFLRQRGPTSGEALTLACKAAGIVPHDDRAFGPVYFTLARRGLIRKVGEARRLRGHGTAGGIVWALA